MKSKKVMLIKECWFKLPDDFNGSKYDAFMLMADFVKEHKEPISSTKPKGSEEDWKDFWEDDNATQVMNQTVFELDEDGHWQQMNITVV